MEKKTKYSIPSRQPQADSLTVEPFFGVFWLSGVPGRAWLLLRQSAGKEPRGRLTTKTQMCDGSRAEDRCVFVIRALMFSGSDMLRECLV